MKDSSISTTFSSIINIIFMIIFIFLLIWFTSWYYKKNKNIQQNYVIDTNGNTPGKRSRNTPNNLSMQTKNFSHEPSNITIKKSPILSKFY